MLTLNSACFASVAFPYVCSHFSFPVNLLEILKGFKSIPPSPIPPFLSHFFTLTLVSWLQQGLKRLQFISTRSVDGGLI